MGDGNGRWPAKEGVVTECVKGLFIACVQRGSTLSELSPIELDRQKKALGFYSCDEVT